MLVLPYYESYGDTLKNKVKQYAYFLPEDLTIQSTVLPQERSRGIYKVMLYSSVNKIEGRFNKPMLEQLQLNPQQIVWNEAYILFNITDAKGLNEELKMKWKDSAITLSPSANGEGFTAPLKINNQEDLNNVQFSTSIELNGSEKILFTPLGKTTSVTINSKWPHPSYTGNILPQTKNIIDTMQSATWKSLSHKRNFPQQWKNASYSFTIPYDHIETTRPTSTTTGVSINDLGAEAFGLDLYIPVNGYQKTLRCIKYAVLIIILTFCAFFLIETVNKRSVHPFQYGLVGLALILFYTLLLSFSEYISFNLSYSVAAIATIGLISWFVKGILQSGRLSTILSVILILLYSFIFSILQLQDYALLLGSIGLFISLAVVMYFSRKLQW
jgi:inner membrane protein